MLKPRCLNGGNFKVWICYQSVHQTLNKIFHARFIHASLVQVQSKNDQSSDTTHQEQLHGDHERLSIQVPDSPRVIDRRNTSSHSTISQEKVLPVQLPLCK
jgi:hypothetical protein